MIMNYLLLCLDSPPKAVHLFRDELFLPFCPALNMTMKLLLSEANKRRATHLWGERYRSRMRRG